MLSNFESCTIEPYNSLPYIYMYLLFCVAVAWDLFREWRFFISDFEKITIIINV